MIVRFSEAFLIWLLSFTVICGQNDAVDLFQDCEQCPKMVVIPSGSIYVGSYPEEIGRRANERDRTMATIENEYAMGQTEVTLKQYRAFVTATNHKSIQAEYKGQTLIGCNYFDGKSYGYIAHHNWKNPGYPQREDAPVVCVSWSDAKAYVDWLTEITGRTYRIPSTIEFEYASRAGSNTPWFWGTDLTAACDFANIGDRTFGARYPSRPTFPCDDGYVYTASVAKFKPNDFGLYDMVGNAWEWTNDCFHQDLTQGPLDGSSWEADDDGDCTFRTPKGGSWISGVSWSRAAVRSRDGAHYKSFMLGFRVAAELDK